MADEARFADEARIAAEEDIARIAAFE